MCYTCKHETKRKVTMSNFLTDLDSVISQNTSRIEKDEQAIKKGVNPPFLDQAIRQSEAEKNLSAMREASKSMINIRNHQDLGLNLPSYQATLESMQRPYGYQNKTGSMNQHLNQGKTAEQIEIERKRKATAPTKLLHRKVMRELAQNVKTKVFGQDEVVDEIVSILKVACLGIQINKEKPAGCYFLAGPSGCGKTEMVMAFSKFLSEEGRPMPFLKLNMGEYGMENDVTKLIGPPPGYNGNENGGYLTNFVLENPISIILFDEMEKAHESMDKIFLSILDKGVCSDGLGREVKFNNTIIFVTSNLGADIEYHANYTKEEKHEYRMEAIHESMRPEIVNRFDIIAQCNALPLDVYEKVMHKFLDVLYKDMKETHNVTLTHEESLLKWAAEASYDPAMGGRPARKFIEKVMIKPLADSMINEDVDFEVNKNLVIALSEEGNICFKDKETNKILGEFAETKKLVEFLQSAKFIKKDKKATSPNGSDLLNALQSMKDESLNDNSVVDVLSEVNATEAPARKKRALKPAKVDRTASRGDFSTG